MVRAMRGGECGCRAAQGPAPGTRLETADLHRTEPNGDDWHRLKQTPGENCERPSQTGWTDPDRGERKSPFPAATARARAFWRRPRDRGSVEASRSGDGGRFAGLRWRFARAGWLLRR